MTDNHKVTVHRELESSDPLAPARGIIVGVLICVLGYLVAGVLYLLATIFVF